MMQEKDTELDMEKGGDEPPQEGPVQAKANNKSHLWKITAALLTVGIIVFVVTFSVIRTGDDDEPHKITDDTNSSSPSVSQDQPLTYTSTDGAFDVTLELFSKDITSGYEDTKLLEDDLSNAAKFLLNSVIKRNTQYDNGGIGMEEPRPVEGTEDTDAIFESAPEPVNQGTSDMADTSLTDFGQNNQEDNVEEGDMMVSNGVRGKIVDCL